MRCVGIVNRSRNVALANRVLVAESFLSRLRGLLFRPPLKTDEGLLFPNCRCVHGFWLASAIDCIALDTAWKVTATKTLEPGKIFLAPPETNFIFECSAGKIAATKTAPGDQLMEKTLA